MNRLRRVGVDPVEIGADPRVHRRVVDVAVTLGDDKPGPDAGEVANRRQARRQVADERRPAVTLQRTRRQGMHCAMHNRRKC